MAAGLTAAGQLPAEAASRPHVTSAEAAAPRVTGVVHTTAVSALNSQNLKDATASCPEGKVVLGGSAMVVDVEDPDGRSNDITLTRMVPYRSGTRYRFGVTAVETVPGTGHRWWVFAEAICADPMPGYAIVSAATPYSTASVQRAVPVCPSTQQRVLGTGAMINILGQDGHIDPDQQGVGLQVLRTDAFGGLTRTQAQEQPYGYAYDWQLVGKAVCANTPLGYEVRTGESEQRGTETVKSAEARCTGDRRLVNRGGSLGTDAPGHVTLNSLGPTTGGNAGTFVVATENWSTEANWSVMAQAICVDR